MCHRHPLWLTHHMLMITIFSLQTATVGRAGNVVNLMAFDAQKFFDFGISLHLLKLSSPHTSPMFDTSTLTHNHTITPASSSHNHHRTITVTITANVVVIFLDCCPNLSQRFLVITNGYTFFTCFVNLHFGCVSYSLITLTIVTKQTTFISRHRSSCKEIASAKSHQFCQANYHSN